MTKAQQITATVLIVEDDPTIRSVLAAVLGDQGYRVLTATDGQEALDLAQQEAPALIFLDMELPRVDGWAFAQRYRASNPSPAPIVVMSAVEAERRAAEIAAAAVLPKPFPLAHVVDLAERILYG